MHYWTSLVDRFKGSWVALADDEITVIASGETAREVLIKAKKAGHAHPILARIPDSLGTRVGNL